MPRTLTIGIVSGCLVEHFNVREGEHFHEVLPALLGGRYDVEARVLANTTQRMPAAWRLSELCAQGVDAVVVQVRTGVMVQRSRLVRRDDPASDDPLSRRRAALAALRAGGLAAARVRIRKGLVAADITAGVLAGRTTRRAIPVEFERTRAALEYAAGRGVPLLVLGPAPGTFWGPPGRRVWRLTEAAFANAAARYRFRYVSLADGWDDAVHLDADGIHPTVAGHRFIAGRVAEALGPVLGGPVLDVTERGAG